MEYWILVKQFLNKKAFQQDVYCPLLWFQGYDVTFCMVPYSFWGGSACRGGGLQLLSTVHACKHNTNLKARSQGCRSWSHIWACWAVVFYAQLASGWTFLAPHCTLACLPSNMPLAAGTENTNILILCLKYVQVPVRGFQISHMLKNVMSLW